MDLQLQNKVFIVSGGARGIGEAISRALAQEGAVPVIVGRSSASAEALVDELKGKGEQAYFIQKTLGAEDNCKEVIDEIISQYKQIDGVVNNAGTNDGVGLESGSPDAFKQSVTSNLTHYYYLVHYALPYLKVSRGSILNISSKTAVTGQGGTSGYAAAKGAQLALTREWAVELAPYGIRVNAIVPAEVMTPQYEKWIRTLPDPEKSLQKITANIPLGKRMTEASEIAASVVFILSERSSHTTGQWLFVDGGYVHFDRAMLKE